MPQGQRDLTESQAGTDLSAEIRLGCAMSSTGTNQDFCPKSSKPQAFPPLCAGVPHSPLSDFAQMETAVKVGEMQQQEKGEQHPHLHQPESLLLPMFNFFQSKMKRIFSFLIQDPARSKEYRRSELKIEISP